MPTFVCQVACRDLKNDDGSSAKISVIRADSGEEEEIGLTNEYVLVGRGIMLYHAIRRTYQLILYLLFRLMGDTPVFEKVRATPCRKCYTVGCPLQSLILLFFLFFDSLRCLNSNAATHRTTC